MYVTDENINTIVELQAFVDGALESADDEKYWQGLASRSSDLYRKMATQRNRQDFNNSVQRAKRLILKQKRE